MKQKKLIFNFFVNRNWKKLTDSRKRAKILADNRKSHHPIETLVSLSFKFGRGPLRFVTSHSRFALASLRNHARNDAPEEGTTDVSFGR